MKSIALATAAALALGTPGAAATLTTLASFDGTNGVSPRAGLTADAAGNLYGTTYGGGASGAGTVFKLATGSGIITTLASFDYGGTGAGPTAGLIADAGGDLYGTTTFSGPGGAGTVFKLTAGSNIITTLASFDGVNGGEPYAGLIADAGGNLYGTTYSGGAANAGTVFKLAAGSDTIATLASFEGANGSRTQAALIADAAGNLYGTTQTSSPSGAGTVFKLAAGSSTITTLARFDGAGGRYPVGGLTADTTGNLYGTTAFGGSADAGTVFKLAAGSNTITTLASFNGRNGASPFADVIADAAGNLYGTTFYGGADDAGTVFKLVAGSNRITTLASFKRSDGAFPAAGLNADAAGNLFGTTSFGGASDGGTVFRITGAGWRGGSAVPEPATWAMLIVGFSLIGLGSRRQRAVA